MPPFVLIEYLAENIRELIENSAEDDEDTMEKVAALSAALACCAMEHAALIGFDLRELLASVEANLALEKASKH